MKRFRKYRIEGWEDRIKVMETMLMAKGRKYVYNDGDHSTTVTLKDKETGFLGLFCNKYEIYRHYYSEEDYWIFVVEENGDKILHLKDKDDSLTVKIVREDCGEILEKLANQHIIEYNSPVKEEVSEE